MNYNDLVIDYIDNCALLLKIVSYKREEEKARKGGIDSELKIKDFRYINEKLDKEVEEKFNLMQDIYVFDDEYKINFKDVIKAINELKNFIDV